MPAVASKDHYVQAISLSRVASDVEGIAAPALTGALIAIIGLRWVFWFDAATYLLSAILVGLVRVPGVTGTATSQVSPRTILSEIAFGTRLLFRVPAIRLALLLSFAEATAGAAAIVITVAYVREILHRGETEFTLLMAGVGLGSTVTAILIGRFTRRFEDGFRDGIDLHRRRHRWTAAALLLGGILLSVALLPGVFLPTIFILGFLWILNGAGQALVAIPSGTLLAEHTEESERGRAYAAHFALTHACWLITYPAAGHATTRFGAPSALTLAGILCIAITSLAIQLGRVSSDA